MKRWRMSPPVRLSVGLSLFTVSLLLLIELLGLFPDPQQAILDSRKKTCESLAVYASLAVQRDDMHAIQTTMDVLGARNEDILSAALRRKNGQIWVSTGDHQQYWVNTKEKVSTLQNVQVPIYRGDILWGTFEVSFKAMYANLLQSLWDRPMVKIIAMVIPLAFLGFFMLMKKTLRHLDPSAVIPERVKRTLDSLVEGVVLMDHQERIVMANKAFQEQFGDSKASCVGRKASDLGWRLPRTREPVDAYPWQQAIRQGTSQAAISLTMKKAKGERRTFMVNGAPIVDAKGKTRGALATFDDVTDLENQNSKLQRMLVALRKSRDEVHRQNEALQILATQDPLTGCLNRRAFYERFEAEFSRAKRYEHEFACIMVDIDHFKSVNDNYGHQVGDEVLKKVSQVLRNCLRTSDIVCRYGGEEFCLILTETGLEGALFTAERIRETVAANDIDGIDITVSLGVSALDYQPANPSDLLNQADKALYRAKNSGRNRSLGYDPAIDDRSEADGEKKITDAHIPHHVVKALLLALEHRDVPTAEHCRNVGDLCVASAQELMTSNEINLLEIAGLLHDIGKLGVSDSILLKPEPLTKEEMQILQDHERRSVDVIASTFSSPVLVDIVRYQRHWFDGSKSADPNDPQGEAIPLGARILNIADAFDAMVSHRPYREACSYANAFQELRRCAGTQFDPQLVEHFIKVVQARDESRRMHKAVVTDSVKLEIGREVETLLVAVNTASWEDLTVSARHLAVRASHYGLEQIASVAKAIETAAKENRGQMEIMEMTSKLLGLYGPLKAGGNETMGDSKAA
jgi:diguanylate cyclase (GGDEF)-like protein/PAS domain S-box-containing protein